MTSVEPQRVPNTADETLLRTAIDCYLTAIFRFAECLEAVRPEIAAPYKDHLIRLRKRLAFETTAQTLEESRQALCTELANFSLKAREYRELKTEDVSQITALLSHAGNSFALAKDGYTDQFRHLARDVREIQESGNPVLAAHKLDGQLKNLEQFVEAVYAGNGKLFSRMQDQMEQVQLRLQAAEILAAIDPLTGLGNRREFDQRLEAYISSGRPFCLLLLDIDGFKDINDQYGHLGGDEVLKQAGARLVEQIRTRDFACRWGGDEFVVVLEAGLANATLRSKQIASWLDGPYSIGAAGGKVVVSVRISVAVAEYVPGESAERIFDRVDQLLYRSKTTGPSQLAQLAEQLQQAQTEAVAS